MLSLEGGVVIVFYALLLPVLDEVRSEQIGNCSRTATGEVCGRVSRIAEYLKPTRANVAEQRWNELDYGRGCFSQVSIFRVSGQATKDFGLLGR